jgi:hypothetical protein
MSQIRLDLPLIMQKPKKRTKGGHKKLRMPGAVIARSMPIEGNCVLGLKANEIDGTRTKLFAQELLDVPRVVDHGRLR